MWIVKSLTHIQSVSWIIGLLFSYRKWLILFANLNSARSAECNEMNNIRENSKIENILGKKREEKKRVVEERDTEEWIWANSCQPDCESDALNNRFYDSERLIISIPLLFRFNTFSCSQPNIRKKCFLEEYDFSTGINEWTNFRIWYSRALWFLLHY